MPRRTLLLRACGFFFVFALLGTTNAEAQVLGHTKVEDDSGGCPQLGNDDNFGQDVTSLGDLDGNGFDDLAIGAPGHDVGGDSLAGAVFILFMNDSGVQSCRKIHTGVDGLTMDPRAEFGTSLVWLGDALDLEPDEVGVLAVGSVRQGSSGAIWLLTLNDAGEVTDFSTIGETEISLSPGVQFGSSIESLGDFDSDPTTALALAVGAPLKGALQPGSIHIVFLQADGAFASSVEIDDSQLPLGDFDAFGHGVANLSDLDDTGPSEVAVAVGAPGDDQSTGSVWIVFLDANASILGHQKIDEFQGSFEGDLDEDRFGIALGAGPDLNGDGIRDLAVGARKDDDGGADEDRGAVWLLYMKTDGTVACHQKISDTEGGFTGGLEPNDFFGDSVSWLGDPDGNGPAAYTLAVGATNDDGEGVDRGAVFLLELELPPAPSWLNYGTGCPGTNGIPSLTVNGLPRLGCPFEIVLENSLGVPTIGALALGFGSLPDTGCGLLVLPSSFLIVGIPFGSLNLPVEVPCDAILAGLQYYVQGLQKDDGAAQGVSYSPGLELTFGY